MKIQKKISVIFLAFIIIPVLFVGYMVFYNAKQIIEKETFSKLNVIADQEVQEIENFMQERLLDLFVVQRGYLFQMAMPILSRNQGYSDPTYLEVKKKIDQRVSVLRKVQNYVDIKLVDLKGKVIYSSNLLHGSEIGQFIPDKEVILRRIKSGVYIGPLYKCSHQGHPDTLSLASSVLDETDQIIGVIVLVIDVNDINKHIVNGNFLTESWEALLVNKSVNNMVNFVSPMKFLSPGFIREKIVIGSREAIPAQKALLGENGSGLSIDYRNEKVLSAWRSIPSLGWGFVLKVDAAEALLPVKKLLQLLIVIIICIVFSALFASFAIARSISNPIKALHKGVEKVTSGDLAYRVGTNSKDEIGQLTRSFDEMIIRLEETTVSSISLSHEVASRKLIEEEALNAKKDWEDSFDAIGDMITIHDKDFRILRANKAAEKVLGLPMGDILRQPCFASYHGTECPPEGCPSCETLKTGVAGVSEVFEEHLQMYVEIKAMPRFDDKGNIIGLVHIVRDITDRKKVEEDLSKVLKDEQKTREIMTSMLEDNNLIRDRLEQHLKDLKSSQNMLIHSEKLASLGRLVSEIAHEVNNPLMIISGNAQLSLMEESISDAEKKNLDIIVKECQRAKDVIRRVLRFARPGKGDVIDVDINQSIEAVAGIVDKQFILSDNVEIKRNYVSKVIYVKIDEPQMQEVFMNLLNNAKEAMLEGGVITITTKLEGEFLRVDFADTGPGMSEDVLRKVMEPFFTTKETGTGIGLAICYGILKSHGGELKFESEVGKGTTAIILLPLGGRV